MLTNKHHEMETLLYVITVTGHFLSARLTLTTLMCSGQFVFDMMRLLKENIPSTSLQYDK
jgi:hypothetical protein